MIICGHLAEDCFATLLARAVPKPLGLQAMAPGLICLNCNGLCTCAVTVASWSSRSDIRRSMASGSRPAMPSTSKDESDCNPDGANVRRQAASRRPCHHPHSCDRIHLIGSYHGANASLHRESSLQFAIGPQSPTLLASLHADHANQQCSIANGYSRPAERPIASQFPTKGLRVALQAWL